MIVVDIKGSGDFSTIQAAVDYAQASNDKTIFIKKGHYHERIEVTSDGFEFLGEDREKTIIEYNLGAFEKLNDGYCRGTFRTSTVLIDADNVLIENLTIENSAGIGSEVGQGIALFAEGDGLIFRKCNLIGNQDTLYTGPLPPFPNQHRGFVGPKEFSKRVNGRQLYDNCYIKGDIDFIFGSATAYFNKCLIESNDLDNKINGFIAAPSTPKGQEYGYIFYKCRFISNAQRESVYLARPWREWAQSVYIACEMGNHIHREGFHDWEKGDAEKTTFFAEYKSEGPGSKRINTSLAKTLSFDSVEKYALNKIFKQHELRRTNLQQK